MLMKIRLDIVIKKFHYALHLKSGTSFTWFHRSAYDVSQCLDTGI